MAELLIIFLPIYLRYWKQNKSYTAQRLKLNKTAKEINLPGTTDNIQPTPS